MLLTLPEPIAAQTQSVQQPGSITVTDRTPGPDQTVSFTAEQVVYDSDADVVTASGAVRMAREGNYLAADQVVWNRKTDEVRARGNIVLLTPEGDKLVGEDVVLSDQFRDAAVNNLLVVLENGARIAAQRGTRKDQVTTLENAIYSPCPVTTETGCPKRPSY